MNACEHTQEWLEDISTIGNGNPGFINVRCRRCAAQLTIACPGHDGFWEEVNIDTSTLLRHCNRCGFEETVTL